MIKIIGEEKLLEQMAIYYDAVAICIIGPAGIGKTTIAEKFKNTKGVKIDKVHIERLQGVTKQL